ncbi:MAG: polysaccharide deacetylase family protein [Clostridia bacterium]|nr:polysaccharide deacetylase family protein [Clostridia bacterium]
MYKKALNVVFLILILVVTGALVFSCFTIHNKNKKIEQNDLKISENKELISNYSESKEKLEQEIADKDSKLKETQSQLEAEKKEKDRLASENANLKTTIEMLKKQNSNTNKICYLTFDDGPSDNTLKVLDVLKRYNVKATFFVIKNSKAEYIKKISEQGHTVGLHTATHSYPLIYSSEEAYYNDLNAISAVVEEQIGIKSNVIRFPGGSSNVISKSYCNGIMTALTKSVKDNGYFYYDWNVDSGDASGTNVRYTVIRDNVLRGARNKNSICVLMHDTSAKSTTVRALPEIIEGLIAMGYRFEALTEYTYSFAHETLSN